MDKKMLIGIVVAAVVVAAAAGIAVFALSGDDNTDDNRILVIKEAGTYNGTYDSVIIDPAVGDGTVTLNGVVINGDLKINGGGSHSIILTNCEINGDTVVAKDGGETPRIYADGTDVSNIIANCNVILESANGASFAQVNAEGKEITIQGDNTSVDKITVTGGKLTIDEKSTVDKVEVSGNIELNIPAGSVSAVTVTGNASITGTVDVPLVSDSAEISNITVNGESKHVHHMVEVEPAVAPTCISAGHTAYYKCSNYGECGFDYPAEILDPIMHIFGNPIGKASTCTEAGIKEHWHCSSCDRDYIKDENAYVEATEADLIIPAAGHDLEHHEAVAATCTADGNIEYYVCKTCNKYFSDSEAMVKIFSNDIPTSALGHDWEFTAIPAEGGGCTVEAVCNRDHAHDVADVIYAQGSPKEGTGPTCTEPGVATYILYFAIGDENFNGIEVNTEELPATGHNWLVTFQWSADHSAANYTAACLNNHDHDTSGSATVTDANTDATCTGEGVNGKIATATVDGQEYTDKYGDKQPALGHSWGDTTYAWTETADGYKCTASHTCTREGCGYMDSEEGTVTSETIPGENCTDPTAVKYTATFTKFDKDTKSVPGESGSHDYIDHEGKAATCTVSGWEPYKTCKKCDYNTSQAIDALGHHLVHVEAVEATIGHDGHNEYDYCDRDGCDYTTMEVIPALQGIDIYVYGGTPSAEGYTYDVIEGMGNVKHLGVPENTVVTITYDTAAGKTFREWSDDRYDFIAVQSFTILAEKDAYILANYEETMAFGDWIVVSKPDCETEGLAYRETTDGFHLRQYVVLYPSMDLMGHTPSGITVILEPTCTEHGLAQATCTECGKVYQYEIDPIGHKLDSGTVILEANGSIVGQKEYACTNNGCDYKEYRNYVSPIYPTGDRQVNVEQYYQYYSNGNYQENHTVFTTDDGKTAYVYAISGQKFNTKDDGYNYSFFMWVDEGTHSPVYVKRGIESRINTNYAGWGIVGYADSLEDFEKYLDDTTKGFDNGRNNSNLFALMDEFADRYNAYNGYWYKGESFTYLGKTMTRYYTTNDTSEPGYYYVDVDENYCTYLWGYRGYDGYNEIHIKTLDAAAEGSARNTATVKIGYISYNPYKFVSEELPERENVKYYQQTEIYQGNWFVYDSYMDDTFYYSMRDVTLPFNLYSKDLSSNHMIFDHFEIKGLDGGWYFLTDTQKQSTIYIDGKACKTVIDVFDALSNKYGASVFVSVADAKFDNIHLRAIYVEEDPDCTVTGSNCVIDVNGDRMQSTKVFSGRSIYAIAEEVPGKIISGWNVTFNGNTTFEEYSGNWYYYRLNDAGTYVFEPTYIDAPEVSILVNVIGDGFVYCDGAVFSEKTVTGVSTDRIILQAINGIGYHFIGWKVAYEEEGGEEDLALLNDEEGYGYLMEQGITTVHFEGVVSVTAIFVKDLTHYDIVVTDGFVMDPNYKLGLGEGYKLSNLRAYLANEYYDPILYLYSDLNKAESVRWDVTVDDSETERIISNSDYTYLNVHGNTVVDGVFYSELKHYTLSFNGNGGTGSMADKDLVEGKSYIDIPQNKYEMEGHDFTGWKDQDGNEYPEDGSINVTKDTILTAQWAAKTTTVYYSLSGINYNFYTYSGSKYLNVTYGEYTTIPALSDIFSKTYGFTITAWKDQDGNTYATDGTGKITYGVERLTAVIDNWTVTVEFDSNGAIGAMDSIVIEFDGSQTYDLPENTVYLERLGYHQSGWYFNAECTGDYMSHTDQFYMTTLFSNVAGDGSTVTLYAKWEATYYKISYQKNLTGASGFSYADSFYVTYSNSYSIRNTDIYSMAGCTVGASWNTKADGTGVAIAPGSTWSYMELIEDAYAKGYLDGSYIYLYAQWAGPVVIYNSNGVEPNDIVSCKTYSVGGAFETYLNYTMYNYGYEFLGYSLTKDGDALKSTDIITEEMAASNGTITLYAIWKVKE